MAWCDLCQQDDGYEAKPGDPIPDSCVAHKISYRYFFLTLPGFTDPIPYGDDAEGWKQLGITPPERCHDCRVKIGGLHHPGCDMERCPVCVVTNGWGVFSEARRMGQRGNAVQAMLCAHCKKRVAKAQDGKVHG